MGGAVAILAVAGLLPSQETSETQLGAAPASAATVLNHAARAAERQPGSAQPGQSPWMGKWSKCGR